MPAVNCKLYPVLTRDALIDYFRRHKVVRKVADATELADAA
jgi:hypothetical protein